MPFSRWATDKIGFDGDVGVGLAVDDDDDPEGRPRFEALVKSNVESASSSSKLKIKHLLIYNQIKVKN